MSAVLKYRIHPAHPGGCQPIDMPAGARIVHVDTQGAGVYAWALVDEFEDTPVERRLLGFTGTGVVVPAGWEYVGTAATPDRALLWHVFEQPR